jgi:hypothetical protein
MLIEDIDCSGLTAPPEDGEFILADPSGATAVTSTVETSLSNVAETGLGTDGVLLRMVWSSALRSDRSALGDKRVPVITKGGGRFRTKYFLCEAALTPKASGYVPGAQLTVLNPAAAHRGTQDRGILAPADSTMDGLTDNHFCWVVGYVTKVTNDSAVSGTGEIEFMLYSEPRTGVVAA